jgi:hypothetical protein
LRREHIERLRGFDEDYKFYGFDDDDFAFRLLRIGVNFQFRDDIVVHHQWHECSFCYGIQSNEQIFREKMEAMMSGLIGPERNLGREWGSLEA